MAWSQKRSPDLVTDLNLLIGDLCLEWGVCNRLSASELVSPGKSLSASEFARAVLAAEKLDANGEISLQRRIKRVFSERYGEQVSLETWL